MFCHLDLACFDFALYLISRLGAAGFICPGADVSMKTRSGPLTEPRHCAVTAISPDEGRRPPCPLARNTNAR